ncbi:MAG: hypothetical protein LBH22_01600 [Bacteroidales bacterium]|jgi:hypothetical protein|nr:hypothetical protein [Bacteroidales bacterium]
MKHTFILSDESVNDLGIVVLTNGIQLGNFLKNPVLLYKHDRESGVIGRWENIRIEGNKLLGEAVFDESDELGKKIKLKVENGFLRSASIGIENVIIEDINGVKTAISSVLVECSIADIPANKNAVKLCKPNGNQAFTITNPDENNDIAILRSILDFLALPYPNTQETVLNALKSLKNGTFSDEQKEIEIALKYESITKDDAKAFLTMSKENKAVFLNFVKNVNRKSEKSIDNHIDNAISEGRFLYAESDKIRTFAKAYGITAFNELLSFLPKRVKITELIDTPKEHWTLDHYRQHAPLELIKNNDLYNALLKKEGAKAGTTGVRDLDWYRKNDPQYLKDNPDEYKRLIAKFNQK